ncbi:MAG: GNAT family N-acetyltransferase [Limosilactobacillus sp.]
MIIRKFQPEDLDQIMPIWLVGNCQAYPFIDQQYWVDHQAAVREALQKAEVWVAEQDATVVGFAGLQGDYLAGIFVKAAFQHQGVGRQLIERIQHTHDTVTLDVYVANQGAIRFYRHHGFRVIREQVDETGHAEYLMCWDRSC